MKRKITSYSKRALIAFGRYISEVRVAEKLSQKDLASKLNIDEGKISLIEAGECFVDFNDAKTIARALDINPRAIAGFYGKKVILTKKEKQVLKKDAPKGAYLPRTD